MYNSFEEYVDSVCRLDRNAEFVEAVLKKVEVEKLPALQKVLSDRMANAGIVVTSTEADLADVDQSPLEPPQGERHQDDQEKTN